MYFSLLFDQDMRGRVGSCAAVAAAVRFLRPQADMQRTVNHFSLASHSHPSGRLDVYQTEAIPAAGRHPEEGSTVGDGRQKKTGDVSMLYNGPVSDIP